MKFIFMVFALTFYIVASKPMDEKIKHWLHWSDFDIAEVTVTNTTQVGEKTTVLPTTKIEIAENSTKSVKEGIGEKEGRVDKEEKEQQIYIVVSKPALDEKIKHWFHWKDFDIGEDTLINTTQVVEETSVLPTTSREITENTTKSEKEEIRKKEEKKEKEEKQGIKDIEETVEEREEGKVENNSEMQDELDENNLSSCLICKSTENLVSTDDIDDNTVTWRQKLSYLLPELDWAIILKLCSNCRGELDKVCFFRNKCINSYIKTVASIDYPKNNEMLNFTPELIKYNENFECSDCKITFNNITNLINHKKSHFHACNVCSVTFLSMIDLENHSTLRHTLESTVKFPSENSSEIKIEPTEIFLHCEINYDETEIKEKELSGDEANSSTEVDETCDSETNKINYYGCEQCELSFKKNCLLKQHVLKVHTDKKFICDICEGKFSTQGYLNSHMKFHIGIRSHTCSFCGKGFINGSDLRHHEKIHTNKRAYKCDKCSKGFNTASILQKHIMVVHTDRSLWKYVCSHCDKRFPLKIGLDQHTKIHTGERDHECQFCSKKFITNNKLQIHLKSHSNVAEFECHLCGQKYKHQRHLKDHMARVHSIGDAKIPTRDKVKKHFCHICPKSYFANNKLQKHIRSHTGEKPFQCSICDKSFTDNTYKKYHLKTVHNVIEEENVLN